MKKILFIILTIILILVATYFILDFTRVKKRQSVEIKNKYNKDTLFLKDDLTNLPLLLFETVKPKNNAFMILFPGDGGWRDFIDTVARVVSHRGMSVVGFNTIPYFIDKKKPKQIAKDINRIIHNFSHIWKKRYVILCGYSFTAEILPFVYNAMDSSEQKMIKKIILIAPTNMADFKVSTVYYYNPKNSLPVLPEMNKLPPEKVLIFCDRYKKNICNLMSEKSPFKTIKVNYGHLFRGNESDMGHLISEQIGL